MQGQPTDLGDLHPMYVYLVRTADGVPLVQVAWKEDGYEMYTNHTLEGAAMLGLGNVNCLPWLVLRDNAEVIDVTLDELGDNHVT